MLTIKYSHNQQLSLFYVGLELLRRSKKIKYKLDFFNAKSNNSAVLFGEINRKTFCIDCLDGYNWINGTLEENLSYFKNSISADFIFKRNINPDLSNLLPGCSFFSFGFNYAVGLNIFSNKKFLIGFLNNPYWILRYWRLLSGYYDYTTFENKPEIKKTQTILYQVRLWDPKSAKDKFNQEQRNQMNSFRVACVKALKKHFPSRAIVGVEDSDYARSVCPELIIPKKETSRNHYFNLIRESAIGVTTNGLHHSIGWKMGEYIAASRAIVCERPYFLFPPNFYEGQNYLGFSTPEELLIQVDQLLTYPKKIEEMMCSNQEYYLNYQRPDKLVWNIFSQIF